MKRFAGSVIRFIGRACLHVAYELLLDDGNKRWLRDRGDETLRLDYDGLDERSLVLDLGGYKGQWTSDIFARYQCTVHIFEPVPAFARQIEKRFSRNPRIHVHPFGLSHETVQRTASVAADGSSVYGRGGKAVEIALIRAEDFLRQYGISLIDLMKINIEGGEYDLLDHLIATGLIGQIGNIQVQFHPFVPNAAQRMADIHARLARTHRLTFQYPFVWENWELCPPNGEDHS